MEFIKKLMTIGTSLGVVVDKPIISQLNLKEGDEVKVNLNLVKPEVKMFEDKVKNYMKTNGVAELKFILKKKNPKKLPLSMRSVRYMPRKYRRIWQEINHYEYSKDYIEVVTHQTLQAKKKPHRGYIIWYDEYNFLIQDPEKGKAANIDYPSVISTKILKHNFYGDYDELYYKEKKSKEKFLRKILRKLPENKKI